MLSNDNVYMISQSIPYDRLGRSHDFNDKGHCLFYEYFVDLSMASHKAHVF